MPKAPDWKNATVVAPPPRKPHHWTVVADIAPTDIHWLWRPYIAFGKLTIFDGDPGIGKSWVCCSIAAHITTGRCLPGQDTALPPQNVLIMSAEDDASDTIRPRLEALGADLHRIYVPDEPWILDRTGLREMEEKMREVAATIVFIDPITYYMGGKVDMNRANEIRGLMTPLAQAAKTTGCAVVVVRHLAKASGRKDIYMGLGSIDTTAAARGGLMATEMPDGTKVFKNIKNNLTKKGPPLIFSTENDTLEWMGEYKGESGGGDVISKKPRKIEEAISFLIGFLKDGPQPAISVIAHCRHLGFSEHTLNNAKKGLVRSVKQTDGTWWWTLEAQGG